ncbi:TetR/AcrR family transcriptional regulator [Lacibacter luteus]|uniref:TetR/AcrR family transcriptional regulator n=1 Tax=Lacibacter luteus TaxID=2508719 RepID=UPI0013E90136|nr:TetR/AcrR family transcriptional regulator [Lacibacter luteus]
MKGAVKQEQILEAAIRRLSHFGVHKTTLTEIADDLSISKQALMYYYHDKASLVTSVLEKIAGDYIVEVKKLMAKNLSLNHLFTGLVDMRHSFFGRYHMLFIQMKTDGFTRSSSEIEATRKQAEQAERIALAERLKSEITQGTIREIDTDTTVQLMLDTMAAFAYSMQFTCPIPTEDQLQQLFDRQKNAVLLMINGITTK